MMKPIYILCIVAMILAFSGCATGGTGPYVPPDLPTPAEIQDLVGEWEGETELDTGLIYPLHLNFYQHSNYIQVTVRFNNNYVDDVYVEYDGDRVMFTSSNFWGDYADIDGTIDHTNLIYSGSFYAQMGTSERTGTFSLNKL